MADELKALANEAFRAGHYPRAVELYTQAIEQLDSPRPEYFTNRASAHFQNGDFVAAKADAEAAIDLDPNFTKGYWRIAECERIMHQLDKSVEYYRRALETKPNNRKIVLAIRDVQRLIDIAKPSHGLTANSLLQALHSVPASSRPSSSGMSIGGFGGFPGMGGFGGFGSSGDAPAKVDESSRKDTPELPVDPGLLATTEEAQKVYTREWYDSSFTYMKSELFRSDIMRELVRRASELMNKESTCLSLSIESDERLAIVGDIHGSLPDLCAINEKLVPKIFSEKMKVVFLGDYVDRGPKGHTVVTALLCLKLCFPDRVFLLRGNHETVSMNSFFGYRPQVDESYGTESGMFDTMTSLFATMPLCCLINKEIFCTHGGAPLRADVCGEEINKRIPVRKVEMDDPLVSELTWSDPSQTPIDGSSGDGPAHTRPSHRGVGLIYDYRAFQAWAKKHGIKKLFRAHEAIQPIGVRCDFEHNASADHEHYTVFSSSNYVGMPNKGSFVLFEPGLRSFETVMLM